MTDPALLQATLDRGVMLGVAPEMCLLLVSRGQMLLRLTAGGAGPFRVFDLASLTKPLATAPLFMDLIQKGRLALDQSLADLWGPAVPEDKKGVTIKQLLTHSAGFPAHQPYYTALSKAAPASRKGLLKAMLMNEPLTYNPGEKALYSDLGYMTLGLIAEQASGSALHKAAEALYDSLGVEGPGFLPLEAPDRVSPEGVAPCGDLPGRGDIRGEVHDDNAFALGGVAGHAGLFGTASQAASVLMALSDSFNGQGPWNAEAAEPLFTPDRETKGSTRTIGFDTPSGDDSAAGQNPPPFVVGHLGFTGTSIWWRPSYNTGVVLLTNRVAGKAGLDEMRRFRHELHTIAWKILEDK